MPVDNYLADEEVVASALSGDLDAAVDHVGELQALFLLGERALARLTPGDSAEYDADYLLEPDAQRPGRTVRDVPELGDGPENPVPSPLPRIAVTVEHSGDRSDRDTLGSRTVVDRGPPLDVPLFLSHPPLPLPRFRWRVW